MPRPRNAKVWNLELERALQCRRNDCVATGSSRQTLWLRGEEAIRAAFDEIDTDGSGTLDQQEVGYAAARLGERRCGGRCALFGGRVD